MMLNLKRNRLEAEVNLFSFQAVLNRNFESPIFATYELLLEKAKRGSAEGIIEEHPRRGSRGSILSGKANVDEQPLTPSISAHLLAQLNLSSPDSVRAFQSQHVTFFFFYPRILTNRRILTWATTLRLAQCVRTIITSSSVCLMDLTSLGIVLRTGTFLYFHLPDNNNNIIYE